MSMMSTSVTFKLDKLGSKNEARVLSTGGFITICKTLTGQENYIITTWQI